MGNFPDFKCKNPNCLTGADSNYIEKYIAPIAGHVIPVQIDKHPTSPIPLEELEKN